MGLRVVASLLLLSLANTGAAESSPPPLQLTPLGATLTPTQRSQLKAAAERVIAG